MEKILGSIRTFWHVLINTFTSIDYYRKVVAAPFKFSLKYYVVFLLLTSLVNIAFISVSLLYPLGQFVQRLPAHIDTIYPAELVVTIKNGEVSTNVEEPYTIPMERLDGVINDFNKTVLGATSDDITNFIVIDTEGSVDDYSGYDTAVLVTKSSLSYMDAEGVLQTHSLAEIKNLTINQATVRNYVSDNSFYFENFFPIALGILSAIILFGILFVKFFYMIFLGLIIMILSKVIGHALTYLKSVQIGFHLDSIAMVLFWLVGQSVGAIQIPFLYTMIVAVFAGFVINHLKRAAA